MIPAPTRYARAVDLDHALELLAEPEAKALAGGHSLVPAMKVRLARPELVVDISRLGLGGVEQPDGDLNIGALTTWDELIHADEFRRPALAAVTECARGIGDLQVRNVGTIGGSLAHADPASDMPAVLIALGARLGLRSRSGVRTVAASAFFLGPFLTALGQGELITEIAVPVPPEGSGSAYVAVEHPASGFALAGAAAVVFADGSSRVALTGVAATPFLLSDADDPASALAGVDVFGDRFAPVEYRRQLAATVVRRAVEIATARSEGDRA